MFVNRDRELALLNDLHQTNLAQFFVLYGRRRVGKTELLRNFIEGKRYIYFVADLGSESGALEEFTRQLSMLAYANPDLLSPFQSWDAAFAFFVTQFSDERIVVIFDEFTYLISINDAIPSIFQRIWDTALNDTQIMLILCGSYIGMMEQHVLSYRSPLYGRRTAQWHLQPLAFWDTRLLLPELPADDFVRMYAILGGIPAYLQQFVGQQLDSLSQGIERLILTTGRFLYDEPRFLLLQELREPNRYFSILSAIAHGRTSVNEIVQSTKIAQSSISFYLNTLQEIGLIVRAVPATERNPTKSKRGLYQIQDPYFRFWFRFVYPNRSLLERGETKQTRQQIEEQLDQFVGFAFERICHEYIWRRHEEGHFNFTPNAVGGWWNRTEEIDLVALNDEVILWGECKWTRRPIGTNILDDLKRKSEIAMKSQKQETVQFGLFSRSGFTSDLQKLAEEENILLVDLAEILDEPSTDHKII